MPLSSGFHGQNNAGNHPTQQKPKEMPALHQNPKKDAANPSGPTVVKEHYGEDSDTPVRKEVTVQSKCGSLDNVKHKPGGGQNKIFDQKIVYNQKKPPPKKK